MGTSLTGLTPATTYDALIKVGDNGALSATAKYLSDGLGNDSPLAMSTTSVGIGTTTPLSALQVNLPNYTGADNNTESVIIGNNVGGNGMRIGYNGSTNNGHINSLKPGVSWSNLTIGSTNCIFTINGTEVSRFTSNGLTFNGDTAAANALDDYEEGTWTMGVSFGGASVGVTASNTAGTYTKIGRQVTVNGYLQLTSKGSSTGNAEITGLPFAIANNTANYSAPSLNCSAITFANQFQGLGRINSTIIDLQEVTELGVITAIIDADFANTSYVILSFTYFV
jgi:hypothetical protein